MIRVALLVLTVVLALAYPAGAQQPITYIHDDLGRLVGLVDRNPPAQSATQYSYDAVGNLLSIARFPSTTVSIITFSPGSGPVGATITISGTGFSATPSLNTVTLNGTATTVTSATATRLVTTVPAGATTGPIAVTSPSSSATSAGSFPVTTSGPPTITSVSSNVGAPGDTTTVTGTNYETTLANNRVAFNVTRPMYGRVDSATVTALGVTVPVGATSGLVSVTTPGGKATGPTDFFVPPSPYTAAGVVFTGRIVVDGSSVTVAIPTASKIGMVVFDAVAGQRLSLGLTAITLGLNTSVTIYRPHRALPTAVGCPDHCRRRPPEPRDLEAEPRSGRADEDSHPGRRHAGQHRGRRGGHPGVRADFIGYMHFDAQKFEHAEPFLHKVLAKRHIPDVARDVATIQKIVALKRAREAGQAPRPASR